MSPINRHLLTRLEAIQKALIAQHAGGRGLPSTLAGGERETFVREFLAKVFPSHYRFTTGAVTDSSGRMSGQIDIAVEYPFLPSFPLPAGDQRLLLAESVALVLEVKSNLSKQWSEVEETTRKVKKLRRDWNETLSLREGRMGLGALGIMSIPCVAIGYKGYTTAEGLEKRLQSTEPHCRPDCALVIDPGCFAGPGCCAEGPLALCLVCAVISQVTAQVASAGCDWASYIGAKDQDAPDQNGEAIH
jgi:hypothetical protein